MITTGFFNAVVGSSFRVCLGVEQLEQWHAYRQYFFVLFPMHTTRISRSPPIHLCLPKIRKSYACSAGLGTCCRDQSWGLTVLFMPIRWKQQNLTFVIYSVLTNHVS